MGRNWALLLMGEVEKGRKEPREEELARPSRLKPDRGVPPVRMELVCFDAGLNPWCS